MNHIYYFSGTGNTQVIAEGIVESLNKGGEETELRAIDRLMLHRENISNEFTRIGIGFPVHSFYFPNIIEEFVKNMPQGNGRQAFIFQTDGDVMSINNAGLIGLRKLLRMKGYKVIYERSFIMGSNFLIEFTPVFIKQLYEINLVKINHLVGEMLKGIHKSVRLNWLLVELFEIMHRAEEKYGAKAFGKNLKAGSDCSKCGKCVRECPASNISLVKDNIFFADQCMWCMKCIYACPENCIEPGFLSKVKLGDGYDIKEIINNEHIDTNNFTLEAKYISRYQSYFDNTNL